MLNAFYKQILTHVIILLKSSKKTKKYRNFEDFAKNSTLEEYKDEFFKTELSPEQELSFYVKSLPVCSDDKILFFLENVHKANMSQYFLESLDKKNIAIHIYEKFK